MKHERSGRLLVLDCTIDPPWRLGADFRRYLRRPGLEVVVRRAPQQDWSLDLQSNSGPFTHLIISGSKTGACDQTAWIDRLLETIRVARKKNIAILGVCFGHQMVARAFGGMTAVRRSPTPELGWVQIEKCAETPILGGLEGRFMAFESHFDEVVSVPKDWAVVARSARCAIQSYMVPSESIFGIQFHPEKNFDETVTSLAKGPERGFQRDCIFAPPAAESARNELRSHSRKLAELIFSNFIGQRS